MADKREVIFKGIKRITKMIDTGNENSLLELAIQGASQAKLLADFSQGFQTGQTRNSIQWITGVGKTGGLNDSPKKQADDKISVSLKNNQAAVGATTEHAVYLEFGTRKMAPQPFIRPSLAIIAGDSVKIVAEKMDAEIKKGPLKYGQVRETFA